MDYIVFSINLKPQKLNLRKKRRLKIKAGENQRLCVSMCVVVSIHSVVSQFVGSLKLDEQILHLNFLG